MEMNQDLVPMNDILEAPIASADLVSNSHRPWSQLPQEILEKILVHLMFADHVRFGAVCTSWSSIVIGTCHHKALQFPWMICLEHESVEISVAPIRGDDKVHLLHLPNPPCGRCLGSYKDWLVMADGNSNMILFLNPLSGLEIPLPRRLRLPEKTVNIPWHYFDKVVLSSTPTPNNLHSRSCVVFALKKIDPELAFCIPGAVDEWVLFSAVGATISGLVDIIFHDGALCGLTCNFEVVVFALNSRDLEVARVYHLGQPLSLHRYIGGHMYLVGSGCKIFMAFKHRRRIGGYPPPFSVFEIDPVESKWVEVRSLEGHVLFLGPSFSRSFMVADNSSGYSGGYIYFIDMLIQECPSPSGVFCLQDGSSRPLYLHGDAPSRCSPFWLLLKD